MISGSMTPLDITDFTLTTCLGEGRQSNWDAIVCRRTGLAPCTFQGSQDLKTWAGEIRQLEHVQLPQNLQDYDCRNNRLAWLALQQDNFLDAAQAALKRHGADRVGVFVGTSTSGIQQTELAYAETLHALPDWYQYRYTHNVFSVADFTRKVVGAAGPAVAISTACSSSAKVFASAYRAIATGMCDAAIVGGVDTLCLTTLYGFNSLQLVAPEPCRPFDIQRRGISIGEAGGYALLEKSASAEFALLGYGESGDAYHMSSPHPDGAGAKLAMEQALAKAGCGPDDIDYINLHGTGTVANDLAESRAVAAIFGNAVWASSTKGWTGHTLGAAGIVETCLSLLGIQHQYIPENLHLGNLDPQMAIRLPQTPVKQPLRRALTNSFGFGGSNCSLIVGASS